ncbi:YfgM family protein [Immundisolibacter sp.]|uniref:YfgM family protein n=1 Tax=Immundisolibacter sp. TaxID=1934948 RepID=UPI0035683892
MSTTDADQIEQLRRLWDQYGRVLTALGLAALIGVFGSFFYRGYLERQALRAANLYQAFQQPPAGQTADDLAKQLRDEYPRSSYASFVALLQAKQAVEADKPDQAERHLRWVVEHGGQVADRSVARLRLARLLLDQGKPDEALQTLSRDISADSAALAELKGDIANANDRPDDARSAYNEALSRLPADSGQAALVKLKLDALGHP